MHPSFQSSEPFHLVRAVPGACAEELMVDFILACAIGAAGYLGFKLGAKYRTLQNLIDDLLKQKPVTPRFWCYNFRAM